MIPQPTPIRNRNAAARPRPASRAGSAGQRRASAWKPGWPAAVLASAVILTVALALAARGKSHPGCERVSERTSVSLKLALSPDKAPSSLLDLRSNPSLSPAEHFHHGLLVSAAAPQDDPVWSSTVEVRSGRLLGRVVEPDMSTPMQHLPVVLSNEGTGHVIEGTTDTDGRFELSAGDSGPHVLHVGGPGVRARLKLTRGAREGELLVVLSRMSTAPVPPGTPAELAPEPVPAVWSRRGGKLALLAAPLRTTSSSAAEDSVVALCRWSPAWIGRTVP